MELFILAARRTALEQIVRSKFEVLSIANKKGADSRLLETLTNKKNI
jgi:hypothetical protein